MEKILIYIDDNILSDEVAEKGILLAKALNAQISLLYVIDSTFMLEEENKAKEAGAKKLLQKILDRFNCSALIYIEEGNPKEFIMKRAEALEVDIIVLGYNNKTKKTNAESVGEQILKCSKIPVMLIPFYNNKLAGCV